MGPTIWEVHSIPVGARLRLLMCTHAVLSQQFCRGWGGEDDRVRSGPSGLQRAWLQVSEKDLIPWGEVSWGGFLGGIVGRGRNDSIGMGSQEGPEEGKVRQIG